MVQKKKSIHWGTGTQCFTGEVYYTLQTAVYYLLIYKIGKRNEANNNIVWGMLGTKKCKHENSKLTFYSYFVIDVFLCYFFV